MNVEGKDLMVFVEDKAIAMATSCTLDLTTAVNTMSSKDSGCWEENSAGKLSWTISSDSIVSSGEATTSMAYDKLMKLQIERKEVEVVFALASNANDCAGVPEGGWKAGSGWKGKALITSISITAPDSENATMSITFTGTGKLEDHAAEV